MAKQKTPSLRLRPVSISTLQTDNLNIDYRVLCAVRSAAPPPSPTIPQWYPPNNSRVWSLRRLCRGPLLQRAQPCNDVISAASALTCQPLPRRAICPTAEAMAHCVPRDLAPAPGPRKQPTPVPPVSLAMDSLMFTLPPEMARPGA